MEQIVVIIVFGTILGVLRYIKEQKVEKTSINVEKIVEQKQTQPRVCGGEVFVQAITQRNYLKVYMTNDYPEYSGELEEQDTQEYIDFITPDILRLIK